MLLLLYSYNFIKLYFSLQFNNSTILQFINQNNQIINHYYLLKSKMPITPVKDDPKK